MFLTRNATRMMAGAMMAAVLTITVPTATHAQDAAPAAETTKAFKADPVHSSVVFKIKHMGVAYVFGRFNEYDVKIHWDDTTPANIKFIAEVQATSVDTGNERRDNHLRNPDFFNVEEHPTIKFESKEVRKVEGDKYEMTGDLTLHGTTKTITVPFEKTGAGKGRSGEPLIGGLATFEIKRSDFGMANMIGPVGDDVTLMISIEAKPEA